MQQLWGHWHLGCGGDGNKEANEMPIIKIFVIVLIGVTACIILLLDGKRRRMWKSFDEAVSEKLRKASKVKGYSCSHCNALMPGRIPIGVTLVCKHCGAKWKRKK